MGYPLYGVEDEAEQDIADTLVAPVTNWAALGVKPPPLRPLQYCEFRTEDGPCPVFSSIAFDEMTWCTRHGTQVQIALAEEEKRIS